MAILVRWGNPEKTLLHYIIEDDWSIDEAWNLLQDEVPKLHAEVTYVTDIIIEFRHNPKIPLGVLDFWRRAYNWMQEHHRETSYIAVVQAPPIVKGIADTLSKLRAPTTRFVVFVDSLEQAHQKIATYRLENPRLQSR